MGVYSFLDVQAAINGPGGSFIMGSTSGVSEEGITVEMDGDKGTMVVGADGTPMHSLHASKAGTVTVRLLKTSPVNQLLDLMYRFDTTSSANYGQNVISIRNPASGDSITAQQAGFRKLPNNVNAREGGMMEWIFNCGYIDEMLGNGQPAKDI